MPPVIVGVSGYSRTMAARMIPSWKAHDILLGHLACLLDPGGVPRKGVYDNEAALVGRHGGRPHPTQAFQRFRGALGMGVVICKPGDPEATGLVERANRYLELKSAAGRLAGRDHRTVDPVEVVGGRQSPSLGRDPIRGVPR